MGAIYRFLPAGSRLDPVCRRRLKSKVQKNKFNRLETLET